MRNYTHETREDQALSQFHRAAIGSFTGFGPLPRRYRIGTTEADCGRTYSEGRSVLMICPTCKGSGVTPEIDDAERLYDILKNGVPHRSVYRSERGTWFVTHGGGQFSRGAVDRLVSSGRIQSEYSNCPTDSYHVGRTWDRERTMEARKKFGSGARNYYVGDR